MLGIVVDFILIFDLSSKLGKRMIAEKHLKILLWLHSNFVQYFT